MSLIRSMQKSYGRSLMFIGFICLISFGCDAGRTGGCGDQSVGPDGVILRQYQGAEALHAFIQSAVQLPNDPDNALYDVKDEEFSIPIWILDTRTEAQYNRGHIPKAKNVVYDLSSGEIDIDEIPNDIYLILYCETGGRAQIAAEALAAEGYTKYMVWGGVTDWPHGLVTD